MSSYVRNLVLRGAGLAPVVAPVKKPVFDEPTDALEPPAGVAEEAVAAPDSEKAAEPAKAREPRRAAPVVPAVKERAADRTVSPLPEVSREVPPVKADEPGTATSSAEPPVSKVRVETREIVMPAETVPARPVLESQRSLEPSPAIAAEREGDSDSRPAAFIEWEADADSRPVVEPVGEKQLVFVDNPALPPHILRQVEERVMERVPAEAARVDVHISRVEIVPPPTPPPPAVRPRREPRGFADHRLERNYLNRRWY